MKKILSMLIAMAMVASLMVLPAAAVGEDIVLTVTPNIAKLERGDTQREITYTIAVTPRNGDVKIGGIEFKLLPQKGMTLGSANGVDGYTFPTYAALKYDNADISGSPTGIFKTVSYVPYDANNNKTGVFKIGNPTDGKFLSGKTNLLTVKATIDNSIALGKLNLSIDKLSVKLVKEDGTTQITSLMVNSAPTVVFEEIKAPINVNFQTPVSYGLKSAAVSENEKFTGTIDWTPKDGGYFSANTAYTANVTLKAKENYEFATNSVVDADYAAVVSPDKKTLSFAKTFQKTGLSTLVFNDDPSFDVPTTAFGTAIPEKDFSVAVTGGMAPYRFSLVSGCTWLNVSTEGKMAGTPVGVLSGDAVIKVTDAYNDEKTITISLGKENTKLAEYTVPTNLTATYGDILSKVDINKGNGTGLGTWNWTDSSLSVGNVGNNTFKAIFTPNDLANFGILKDVDITINVVPATQQISAGKIEMKIGETCDLSKAITSNSGNTVVFTVDDDGKTGAKLNSDGKTLENIKNGGTVQIGAVAPASDRNNDGIPELKASPKSSLKIAVPMAANAASDYTVIIPTAQDIKVGSKLNAITVDDGVTGKGNNSDLLTGEISWFSNAERTTSAVDSDLSSLTEGSKKTLYWKFVLNPANPLYTDVPKIGATEFTAIAGDAQKITFAEKAVTKTIGSANFINLATNDRTDGGTIAYESSNTSVATVNPQTGEVTVLAVGATTIKATAPAVDGKYSKAESAYTLTVTAKEITVDMIAAVPDCTYSGTEFKPEPIVKDGNALSKGADFSYSYENNVNAGVNTARVIVKGIGKYSGTATKTFTILQKELNAATFADIAPVTYTGSFIEPTLVVAATETGKPRLNSDYTVSYYDNKFATQNVGKKPTIAISATPNGNYKGNTIKEFIINKAAAPVVSEKVLNITKGEIKNYTFDLNTLYVPSDGGNKTYSMGSLINSNGIFNTPPTINRNILSFKSNNMTYAITSAATQNIVITSDNYADITVGIRFDVVNEKNLTVSGVTVRSKTYDGAYIAANGTPRAQLDGRNISVNGFIYTWKKSSDGTTLVPNYAPKDAGSYVLTVSVNDYTQNYVGSVDIPFIIKKAYVKAVANSYVLYKNSNGRVTLPTYAAIVTALPSKENLNFTLSCSATADSPVGSYPITIVGQNTTNYNISYTDGSLEIKAAPTSLSPKDPSQAKWGDTVIKTPDGKVLFAEAPTANQLKSVDAALEKAKIDAPINNKKYFDLHVVDSLGNLQSGNQKLLLPYTILGSGLSQRDTYSIAHLKSNGDLEVFSGSAIAKTPVGLQITVSSYSPFVVYWNSAAISSGGGGGDSGVSGWESLVGSKVVTSEDIKTEQNSDGRDIAVVSITPSKNRIAGAVFTELLNENITKDVVIKQNGLNITFPKGTMKDIKSRIWYDFLAEFNSSAYESNIEKLAKKSDILTVSFNYNGAFPGKATMIYDVGKEYSGKVLYYYSYNPKTRKLALASYGVCNKEGLVAFYQTYGADYVITTANLNGDKVGATTVKNPVITDYGNNPGTGGVTENKDPAMSWNQTVLPPNNTTAGGTTPPITNTPVDSSSKTEESSEVSKSEETSDSSKEEIKDTVADVVDTKDEQKSSNMGGLIAITLLMMAGIVLLGAGLFIVRRR